MTSAPPRPTQRSPHKASRFPAAVKWIVGIFVLCFVVGLIMDSRNLAKKVTMTSIPKQAGTVELLAQSTSPVYQDPAGHFRMVPPDGWRVAPHSSSDFFDILFLGPNGMELGVQTAITNGLTLDKLIHELKRREAQWEANSHMEFTYIGNERAIRRTMQLYRSKVLFLDFVTGVLAHHIQFRAPPALFDIYEPAVLQLLQTYEPGNVLSSALAEMNPLPTQVE